MKREPVSEQKLAAVVVAYLENVGADVYQEVAVSGGVADIVARVQHEIWIVEVKTSFSLALLAQAMDRRRLAHRVYIAAPYSRHQGEVQRMCDELGIGLLEVRPRDGSLEPRVYERIEGRRWNRRPVELAARLRPEHKTHAKAGAIGAGGRWTPFRNTCEELERIVRAEPGLRLKDAITRIRHHYASDRSARSSLAHWLERGVVPGVRLERGALFPVERPP